MEAEREVYNATQSKGMIKQLAIILVCALSVFYVQAQKADSLSNLLLSAKGLQRGKILQALGEEAMAQNPVKAFEYLQEALTIFKEEGDTLLQVDAMLRISTAYLRQGKNDLAAAIDSVSLKLSEKKNYPKGIATAHYNFGRYLTSKGRLKEAAAAYQKYIDVWIAEGKESTAANAYNQLGIVYRNMSEYQLAKKYLHEAIRLSAKYQRDDLLALAYMNLANINSSIGEYTEAITNHLHSIRIKEKQNDVNGLTQSYQNIGIVYSKLEKPDDALQYYYKVLDLKHTIQNQRTLAMLYNNIGICYAKKYAFDSALSNSQRALTMRKKSGDKAGIAQSLNNIAAVYRDQKDYPKAIVYFEEALNLQQTLQSKDDLANVYSNLGAMYTKTGDIKKGEEYLLKSLDLYRETGSASVKESLHGLTTLYETSGEINKAEVYRGEYLKVSDSLVNDDVKNRLVQLQAEFDVERKEAQLQFEKQQNELKNLQLAQSENKRIVLIVALVITVGLVLALWYHARTRRKAALVLAKKNERIELLIRELHHRVKNNMQTISSLLGLQSFRITDDVARTALREGQTRVEAMSLIHQKLYLDDQLRDVDMEEYLGALSQTLSQSYGYDTSTIRNRVSLPNKKLDVDIAIPLGLIINELIINAFKHAFTTVENPELQVILKQRNDQLVELTVRDNGQGLPDTSLIEKSKSFGLKLVNTLSRQLNGTLTVVNEGGAVFTLVIKYTP